MINHNNSPFHIYKPDSHSSSYHIVHEMGYLQCYLNIEYTENRDGSIELQFIVSTLDFNTKTNIESTLNELIDLIFVLYSVVEARNDHFDIATIRLCCDKQLKYYDIIDKAINKIFVSNVEKIDDGETDPLFDTGVFYKIDI